MVAWTFNGSKLVLACRHFGISVNFLESLEDDVLEVTLEDGFLHCGQPSAQTVCLYSMIVGQGYQVSRPLPLPPPATRGCPRW